MARQLAVAATISMNPFIPYVNAVWVALLLSWFLRNRHREVR